MDLTCKGHIEVICSVRNAEALIEATVLSVLSQTYKNLTLTLVDDGSSDSTQKICVRLATEYPCIKFHQNDKCQGLTSVLAKFVEKSEAQYIARIDAGDLWLPKKLEMQLAIFESQPDLIIVGTQIDYLSNSGDYFGASCFSENDNDIKKNLKLRIGIFEHSSIMFKNIVNYRVEFKYSQDLDLYLRCAEIGSLHCLPKVLTKCQVNLEGITMLKKPLQLRYQRLAYRSAKRRKLKLEEGELKIVNPSAFDLYVWSVAKFFWASYVRCKTSNYSPTRYLPWLICACFIYQPLLRDYLHRIFLRTVGKFVG